jgi:hypothetical protein
MSLATDTHGRIIDETARNLLRQRDAALLLDPSEVRKQCVPLVDGLLQRGTLVIMRWNRIAQPSKFGSPPARRQINFDVCASPSEKWCPATRTIRPCPSGIAGPGGWHFGEIWSQQAPHPVHDVLRLAATPGNRCPFRRISPLCIQYFVQADELLAATRYHITRDVMAEDMDLPTVGMKLLQTQGTRNRYGTALAKVIICSVVNDHSVQWSMTTLYSGP